MIRWDHHAWSYKFVARLPHMEVVELNYSALFCCAAHRNCITISCVNTPKRIR